MKKFDYNSTPIGEKYNTIFKINKKKVNEYLNLLNKFSQYDFIPNSIFANYNVWNSVLGDPVIGTIHLKQKMNYYKNPEINDVFDVEVTIKNKYKKNEKDYLIFETKFYKNSILYCKSLTTYLWGFV